MSSRSSPCSAASAQRCGCKELVAQAFAAIHPSRETGPLPPACSSHTSSAPPTFPLGGPAEPDVWAARMREDSVLRSSRPPGSALDPRSLSTVHTGVVMRSKTSSTWYSAPSARAVVTVLALMSAVWMHALLPAHDAPKQAVNVAATSLPQPAPAVHLGPGRAGPHVAAAHPGGSPLCAVCPAPEACAATPIVAAAAAVSVGSPGRLATQPPRGESGASQRRATPPLMVVSILRT